MSGVAETPDEIRALLDKQAIREALYAYCRSVDRLDAALGHGVFTHAILAALRDPALPREPDASSPGRGAVDAGVLARFVGQKVGEWAQALSRTQGVEVTQTPELIAGELRQGVRVLRLPGGATSGAAPALPARLGVLSTPERARAKMGDRAGQFAGLESGLAAQNVLLQVTTLGLGSTFVGGFDPALGAGTVALGGEDLDAFAMLLLAGGVAAYTPDSIVRHHHRPTYAGLRTQIRGCGAGMGAVILKHTLRQPRLLARVGAAVVPLARAGLSPGSERNRGHGTTYPRQLVLEEVRGLAEAPWRYARSVRHARRTVAPGRSG